jgi:hypothetical protein
MVVDVAEVVLVLLGESGQFGDAAHRAPRPVLLYAATDGYAAWRRVPSPASTVEHVWLALLPLDDPAAPALVSPLPPEERYASWHLVWPDGRVSSRSAAGIDLLAGLGRHRLAAETSRALSAAAASA